MNTETLLHSLLAIAVLVVPLACAYVVVRRIARRGEAKREERRD
jgi:hypothetical protein